MQSSSTLKYTPSYESLVDAVNNLSERLEKATSTNKTLRNDLKESYIKNAKLIKALSTIENALREVWVILFFYL